jgi:IS5 family transposase
MPCVRRVREGKRVEGMDLFGPSTQLVGAGVSKAGRPRLPMRLMISVLYLKHGFNKSDEGLVERWSDTPLWQYFSGMDYYEHRRPCDPTALVKFRKLLGEQGDPDPEMRTPRTARSVVHGRPVRSLATNRTGQRWTTRGSPWAPSPG